MSLNATSTFNDFVALFSCCYLLCRRLPPLKAMQEGIKCDHQPARECGWSEIVLVLTELLYSSYDRDGVKSTTRSRTHCRVENTNTEKYS